MKVRTAREREVEGLSASLPSLSPEQIKQSKMANGRAFIGKRSGWCSACGGEIDSRELWNSRRSYVVCPHCGARLEIVKAPRKTVENDKYYMTLAQPAGDWQVLRNFICDRHVRRRLMVAGIEAVPADSSFEIVEVSRSWQDGNGAPVFEGRSCSPGYYIDAWIYTSPLGLKREHERYKMSGFPMKGSRLSPVIRHRGLKALREDVNYFEQVGVMLGSPIAETLAKGRRWPLFCAFADNYTRERIRSHWESLKVAMRHGFEFKSRETILDWTDYVSMLEYLGKDVHNPKLICPPNLMVAHDAIQDAYARRKQKEEAKAMRERDMEQLKKSADDNMAYLKRMEKVLGVSVEIDEIRLVPLKDVEDFFVEGSTLHHCVFHNEYYRNENCLILSARVGGKRTETIEVDMKSWKIIQCRGACNRPSKYHDKILEFAENSLPKFRRAMGS